MRAPAPLFFAIGVLALSLCGAAGGGVLLLWKTTESVETVFLDRVKPMADLKSVSDSYAIDAARAPGQLLMGQIEWQKASAALAQARTSASENWASYMSSYMDDNEKKLAAEAIEAMSKAEAAFSELSAILAARDRSRLERFAVEQLYPAVDPVKETIARLIALQVSDARAEYQRSQDIFPFGRWVIGFSVAIGFAYLIFMAVSLSRERSGAS